MMLNWFWFFALSLGGSAFIYLSFEFEDEGAVILAMVSIVAFLLAAGAAWPIIFEPLYGDLMASLPQPGSGIQQITAVVAIVAGYFAWMVGMGAAPFALRALWVTRLTMRRTSAT